MSPTIEVAGHDCDVACDERRPLAWRLGFGTTLALAMGAGPIPLFAISALAPFVTDELGLSRTQLGLTSTVAFSVAAAASAAAGKVIELLGARRTLLLLFASAALAVLLTGRSGSYPWLLLAVGVCGFAQSLSNPITNYLVAREVLPGRRGLYMGFKQSGVQLCQFLVGATLPTVALIAGWRPAITGSVLLAAGGVVLMLATVPHEPAVARHAEAVVGARQALPGRVKALAAFAALMGASYQATNAYVPLYAFESVGVSAAVAGAATGVLGGVGCAARILWGRSSDRTSNLGVVLAGVAIGAAVGTAVLGFATPDAPALLWVGTVVHSMTSPASTVVVMLALLHATPMIQVGRSSALVALGMYVGFGTGPLVFGMTVDRFGSYGYGWALLVLLYLLAAALGLRALRSTPAMPPGAVRTDADVVA